MIYYTLGQIALETGILEDELIRLSSKGVFYSSMFNDLVRVDENEFQKLMRYLSYVGRIPEMQYFQRFGIPY